MATAVQSVYRSDPAQEALISADVKRIRTVVVDDSETFLQVACELLPDMRCTQSTQTLQRKKSTFNQK